VESLTEENKDLYWIYCIENKLNGKKYIGKAHLPRRRWASHISVSKKESKYQKYIHRAIAKYGINNFWFRCIDFELSEDKSLSQESYWINFFDTTNSAKGYNLTSGGEGKSGYKHTEETKKMLSELAKNKKGAANPFFGKKHSNKSKNLIRKSRSKLSFEDIEYLIFTYKNDKKSVKSLAKELKISTSHAYELINGKYAR
jgi:group I intron endonuclease